MAGRNSTFQLLVLLLVLLNKPLFVAAIGGGSNYDSGNFSIRCTEREREALLKVKEGLIDPSVRLSSWVGDDCCHWFGVGCSYQTGHVLRLDLGNSLDCLFLNYGANASCLYGGELNPSLLNLTDLIYLNLNRINFRGAPIPEFIGSLKNLRYLDLSVASFRGLVPSSLGNLSNLLHLDLSFPYPEKLWVSDLNWLSGLSSLQYLRLGGIDLSQATTNWLQIVNTLPSLLELRMRDCELYNIPHSLAFVNFTLLSALDLSCNHFQKRPIPEFVYSLQKLKLLDLSESSFSGMVPPNIGNLSKLQCLDLSSQNLKDYRITKELWVSDLNWLPALSSLQYLHLEGMNLSKLTNWLQVVNELPSLVKLHLSNCQLQSFPQSLPFLNYTSLSILELSYNNFNSQIPQWLFNISTPVTLNLRNSQLSGSIPKFPRGNMCNLRSLDLAMNEISGEIEEFIETLSGCNNSTLETLDLSFNKLNGDLPESLGNLKYLRYLELSRNSLWSTSNIYRKSVVFESNWPSF